MDDRLRERVQGFVEQLLKEVPVVRQDAPNIASFGTAVRSNAPLYLTGDTIAPGKVSRS